MRIIIASLSVLALSLIVTPLVRRAAQRFGLVVQPRQDRWHRSPTAIMGGVAIFAAFVAGYLIFAPLLPAARPILIAGTFLFLLGLVDDIFPIKPYTKLVVQFVAAATMVLLGLQLPWVEYEWINSFLTIFWLVGITNAINLLDNMDGLAGGVSLIACVFLTITFLLNGQVAEAILPAMLAATLLGFLVFNFNPASIFMGDSGSMFLGFMVSGIALLSDTGRFRNVASVLLTPVLILMLPIFDTCVVTVTRKLSGRPISQGGRDHTSHRLVALGVSERRAVILLYAFSATAGLIALMVRVLETPMVLVLVPCFALLVVFLGLYLGKVRVDEAEETRGPSIVNALADFSYKRRVFEVLMDVVLIVLAYYGAYVLRWDGNLPAEQLAIFLKTFPLIIMIEISFFLFGGMYHGLWRYVGVDNLLTMVRAVLGGAIVSSGVVFAMYWFSGPSRAVFLLNALLLLVLVSGSRLSFRLLRAAIVGKSAPHPGSKPVLIYGAGDGGELLIKEILNNPEHRYSPVGFIDDDRRKAGRLLHGYRIFDSRELPDLIDRLGITEVLVSSFKVPENKVEDLRQLGLCLKKMSIRFD